MTARQGHGRHAPPSVRHLVRRRLRRILDALSRIPLQDADIHRARMEIKQARAAVHLLYDAPGRRRYRRADRLLRDAARPLGAARDARALLDAVRQLKQPIGAGVGPATLAGLPALWLALRRNRLEARRRLRQSRALEPHLSALRRLLRTTRAWPHRNGWPLIARGVERCYRSGRRACRAVHTRRSAANLHAWRKQAKRLGYQLSLLGPRLPGALQAQLPALERLSGLLGEVHDLALLRATIAGNPGWLPDAAARGALLRHIACRSKQLRRQATQLGAPLYREKPRRVVAELRARGLHRNRRPRVLESGPGPYHRSRE